MKHFIIVIFILFSCDNRSGNNEQLTFGNISMSVENLPADVSYIEIDLNSEYNDSESHTIYSDTLFTLDNLREAMWTIDLKAYSVDSILKYEGESDFQILAGEITDVSVTMLKKPGKGRILITWEQNESLSQYLVAYYPFNIDLDDNSSNNLDGTYVGVNPLEFQTGYENNAMLFDRSNQITFSKNILMEPDEFTISLYAKFNIVDSTTQYQTLYTKYDGYNAGFRLTYLTERPTNSLNYRKLLFQVADENASVINSYSNAIIDDSNKWYHIVVTVKNNDTVSFYIDDVLDFEISFPHTWRADPSIGFSIGSTNNTGYYGYFNGLIDEFKFYNKKLTLEEIGSL